MRVILGGIVILLVASLVAGQGYIKPPKRQSYVISPRPHEYLTSLPTSFSWTNVNGQNYLTEIRNQHLPVYCGSCWAFAATSCLSDRIRVLRNNTGPIINLAPQVLLNCGSAGSCRGGETSAAYAYIAQNGIPDETCAPYQAVDLNCTAINICKNCKADFSDPKRKCFADTPRRLWKVSEYGTVRGEQQMMAEIYARGPISCSMAVTPQFQNYTGGIFKDTTGAKIPNHEISLVGWGVDSATGEKYWIGRNSWGTFWGENGLFRIVRGVNNCAIEDDCTWAVPAL